MFVSGYGNFAAVTFAGRLFCLLFGIIGIPFMLSGQEDQVQDQEAYMNDRVRKIRLRKSQAPEKTASGKNRVSRNLGQKRSGSEG
jgi:hypothetical protein